MALSRAMEYEADGHSAVVAGDEAAISALCKSEVIKVRFSAYSSTYESVYEMKKILPTSFWNGFAQFMALTDNYDGVTMDASVSVSAPLRSTVKSKVYLKNPWTSHPLLQQRIDNIKVLNNNSSDANHSPVQDYVNQDVYDRSSQAVIFFLVFTGGTVVSDEDYSRLLATDLNERSFPLKMKPFFSRDIMFFDIDSDLDRQASLTADEVFSNTNASLVETFQQAIEDFQLMLSFSRGQTTEKVIQYDGKVYKRKNVPLETQMSKLKELEPRVVSVDKLVAALALSSAKDEGLIKRAYNNIFYSQGIIKRMSNEIVLKRDETARQISKGGSKTEKEFKRVQSTLLQFKNELNTFIQGIEIERLYPVMHVETAETLKKLEDDWLLKGLSISGEEIEFVFSIPELIISQFESLIYYSKKLITDTIEGNAPLMYWNNSVAAAREADARS